MDNVLVCHGSPPRNFDTRILAQEYALINQFRAGNGQDQNSLLRRRPYGNNWAMEEKMSTGTPPALFFGDNFGLRNSDLEKVLDVALAKKADYADLYFEYRQNEGISLEEGMVKNCSQSTRSEERRVGKECIV